MLIEFTYRFEAAHRFLKSSSEQCMTPHGHTWYATLGLKFVGSALSDSQMTVEFGAAKKQWRSLIQETFDHSYMHNINDPVAETLLQTATNVRLIPFPGDPTTELISLFLFNKMETLFKSSSFGQDVEVDFIKVQETPTNSIICNRSFYLKEIQNFQQQSGWWTSSDTKDRSFRGSL